MHAPHYIPLVIIRAKYTKGRLDDSPALWLGGEVVETIVRQCLRGKNKGLYLVTAHLRRTPRRIPPQPRRRCPCAADVDER